MSAIEVVPSRVAREELPKVLRRFRAEGAAAEPLIFGAHRKPEAVVIPFDLYSQLLPVIEDLELARLARERIEAGGSRPLGEFAEELGMDPEDYS